MDLSSLEDNSRNLTVKSMIPDITMGEPCCIGIDEAGRGPVLGPMVYGICYFPLSKSEEVKSLGVADSKTLTEEQREDLFQIIDENKEFIGWAINILSPNYLSKSMLRRTKYSLNEVSHDTAIGLINLLLSSGINVHEVYVDTVGVAEKYQDKLQKIFPGLKITVAPKADAKFPVVSAASICAKVARDRVLKEWRFPENIEFSKDHGSGYPSDPTTKKWLADSTDKVFGFPQLVRFSWSTCSNILENKAVAVHWDDDDDDDGDSPPPGTASITSFFAPKSDSVERQRHQFFQERHLEPVDSF
ncbi:ribonuclease H2 subunit A-like [Orbicella faveolata]|uniref:ribonuclease H2 subunit A-like n=1 Tax=Orbicella faveolata TaxID=48498 RepID=UPI0009E1994A|nr:ribonuclease H2 subunit A-like [Orbicella faveolata]